MRVPDKRLTSYVAYFSVPNMEKDGITRVYLTDNAVEQPKVYEVYPTHTLETTTKTLESLMNPQDAQIVLSRTDISCTNIEIGERNQPTFIKKWAVRTTEGAEFSVRRTGSSYQEDYAQLAETLEQQLGKIGLTILIH